MHRVEVFKSLVSRTQRTLFSSSGGGMQHEGADRPADVLLWAIMSTASHALLFLQWICGALRKQ